MRVVFCGSGSFAVPSLKAVMACGHELAGVVTQPARPAGRGGRLRPTPIAQAAKQAGLAAVECPDINAPEGVDLVAKFAPDAMVVADFGQIIRKAARKLARVGAFNLHGSLLPALRGAAPVNWAIIRGLRVTGVTVIRLAAKMDAGEIYLQESTPIDPSERADELKARLAEIGAPLVTETLDLMAAGQLRPIKQDETQVTDAPPLGKSDGLLDWSLDAETMRNRIHGTWPWPGGRCRLRRRDGKEFDLILARARVAEGPCNGPPGQLDGQGAVATGGGRLEILELQPAGGRVMAWRDFVNGYRAAEGDLFISTGQ